MKHPHYIFSVFLFLSVSALTCEAQTQVPTRHDFVKRESKASEMAVGDYAVLATSTQENEAKQIAEEFKKSGNNEVSVGYLNAKKAWFVYVSAKDVDAARAIRDKYRKNERFKDAWILTVHE